MHSSLTITGSLASEVTVDADGNGAAVVRFRVIMRTRRKDPASGLWANDRPLVLPVVCRGRLAENVLGSLRHQDPVVVTGRLRICEVGRRPYIELEASAVGPDLARIRAEVVREDLAA